MSTLISMAGRWVIGKAASAPRALLYMAILLLVLVAGYLALSWYAAGQRLDEARSTAETLRDTLGECQTRNADLSASVASLESGIAEQNARVQRLRADAAEASQSAAKAAETYRTAPARGLADDITPDDVNNAVRERIEDLSR